MSQSVDRRRIQNPARRPPLKTTIPLMLAVELTIPGKEIVKQLLHDGFILNCTHETVLRMLPPFIITEKQIDKFIRALRPVLEAAHA